MKKFYASILLPLMAACSVSEFDNQGTSTNCGGPESFEISIESVTKATLNGLKPEWTENDKVTVFANGVNQCYATSKSGPSAEFEYQATESAPSPASASMYYFVYPYQPDMTISETTVSAVIPGRQTAVKDGVCPEALLMAGKTAGDSFSMFNCVALIQITLSDSNASSVVLTSNSGEKIAGKVNISLAGEGAPSVSCTGNTQVLLTPPAGTETLEAGTYYVAVAPTAISGGLNALVISNDKVYTASSTNALTLSRSEIKNIGDLSNIAKVQDGYKITIDCFKSGSFANPFVNYMGTTLKFPTSFPDNNEGTFAHSEFNLYTPEEDGGFQISGYTELGFGQNSNQGVRILRSEEDYLRLPAINGMKLVALRVLDGANGNIRFAGLANTTDGNFVKGSDSYNQNSDFAQSYLTWYNPNATTGTSYDFRVKGLTDATNGMCGIKKFEIFYIGTPQPTVKAVKTGDCSINGQEGVLNGSYTQFGEGTLTDVVCGFEYRVTGSTSWATISSSSTDVEFSAELNDLDPDEAYEIRAFVKDGERTMYGDVIETSTPTEYVIDFKGSLSNWDSVFDNTIVPLTSEEKVGANCKILTPIIMLSGDHLTCQAYMNTRSGKDCYLILGKGLYFRYYGSNSYLILPAINGMTLRSVNIRNGASTAGIEWMIKKWEGSPVGGKLGDIVTGGEKFVIPQNNVHDFSLSNLTSGQQVAICFNNLKTSARIEYIELSYTGKPLPTVMYVCPPAVNEGNVSSKVYVNSVATASDITVGFEVKSGDSYTDLASASCTGSDGILTASAPESVAPGSVIRAWGSVDGGETKIYSLDYTVE